MESFLADRPCMCQFRSATEDCCLLLIENEKQFLWPLCVVSSFSSFSSPCLFAVKAKASKAAVCRTHFGWERFSVCKSLQRGPTAQRVERTVQIRCATLALCCCWRYVGGVYLYDETCKFPRFEESFLLFVCNCLVPAKVQATEKAHPCPHKNEDKCEGAANTVCRV